MKKSIFKKRSQRIRKKLKKVNTDRFRLSVYKSSKNISAQIIDDKNNRTLISASSFKEKDNKKKKSDLSIHVAGVLAKKALEMMGLGIDSMHCGSWNIEFIKI